MKYLTDNQHVGLPFRPSDKPRKKVSLVGHIVSCELAAAHAKTQNSPANHSLSRLGELHVKACYVSTLPAG